MLFNVKYHPSPILHLIILPIRLFRKIAFPNNNNPKEKSQCCEKETFGFTHC